MPCLPMALKQRVRWTKLGQKTGKVKWASKRDRPWWMKQKIGFAVLLTAAEVSSEKNYIGKKGTIQGGGKVEGGMSEPGLH